MTPELIPLAGGLVCGYIAGLAAQFGRLCTFAAIEDAVVAGDLRRARVWALAVAVAIAITQTLRALQLLDLQGNPYAYARLEISGLIAGATLFGIGMSLVGTCGFGALVRLGTGDLRALVAALVLGIVAFAATGGLLSSPRIWLSTLFTIDTGHFGGPTFRSIARTYLGPLWASLPAILIPIALMTFAFGSLRFLRRLRLIAASVMIGAAVAGGWVVTGSLADPFAAPRPESLSFVAPLGRIVLTAMGQTVSHTEFAIASVVGVVLGSLTIAFFRDDLRWEAFDDQREMRRYLLGAALMGFGGVLARGCTIGQGMSAASTMALSAPIAVLFMVLGARLGLFYLIEGRSILAGRIWSKRQS